MKAILFGPLRSPHELFRGHFYLGGDAPAVPGDPASPDGRAKILNQPSAVRIRVLERRSMIVVADVRAKSDGTWRVDYLMDTDYLVLGLDERAQVNAAVQDWVRPAPMAV